MVKVSGTGDGLGKARKRPAAIRWRFQLFDVPLGQGCPAAQFKAIGKGAERRRPKTCKRDGNGDGEKLNCSVTNVDDDRGRSDEGCGPRYAGDPRLSYRSAVSVSFMF